MRFTRCLRLYDIDDLDSTTIKKGQCWSGPEAEESFDGGQFGDTRVLLVLKAAEELFVKTQDPCQDEGEDVYDEYQAIRDIEVVETARFDDEEMRYWEIHLKLA